MLRVGMVAITAIFALNGCTSDDAFDDVDAGGNTADASAADAFANTEASTPDASCSIFGVDHHRTSCPCGSLADFCDGGAEYGPKNICDLTLDQVDEISAWNGSNSCDLFQSSNTCGNDVQLVLGGGVDFADELYYDVTTRKLVGALLVVNLPQTCWGAIPPLGCDVSVDSNCCSWSGGQLFESECDAGIGDAGNDADAADD